MLKVLAIVTGLIIIITRSGGLLAPATMKRVVTELASPAAIKSLGTELSSKKFAIRVMGVLALGMSLLFFIALENDWTGRTQKETRIAWITQEYPTYNPAADPGGDTADAIGLAEWYVKEVIRSQLPAFTC